MSDTDSDSNHSEHSDEEEQRSGGRVEVDAQTGSDNKSKDRENVGTLVSDVEMEEHDITWKIKKFSLIEKHDKWLNSRMCEFDAGTVTMAGDDTTPPSKLPLKWRLTLVSDNEDAHYGNFIGIHYKLVLPIKSSNEKELEAMEYAKFLEPYFIESSISIDFKGSVYCEVCQETYYECGACPNCVSDAEKPSPIEKTDIYPLAKLKNGVKCGDMIEKSTTTQYVDQKDCLKIKIAMKIFKVVVEPAKVKALMVPLETFEKAAFAKLCEDFKALHFNNIPCTDVKIVTRDKKEFTAQWGILGARSPFFVNMFQSKMKESQSGIIELPDISSKCFDVLLNFIYKGSLLPSWKDKGVVDELMNAAAKYLLTDLLQFLDAVIGSICTADTVLDLLEMAHKLNLKKAEKDLLKYIKDSSMSSVDDFFKLLQSPLNKSSEGALASVATDKANENSQNENLATSTGSSNAEEKKLYDSLIQNLT